MKDHKSLFIVAVTLVGAAVTWGAIGSIGSGHWLSSLVSEEAPAFYTADSQVI